MNTGGEMKRQACEAIIEPRRCKQKAATDRKTCGTAGEKTCTPGRQTGDTRTGKTCTSGRQTHGTAERKTRAAGRQTGGKTHKACTAE